MSKHASPSGFKNQYATVNGVEIHYVMGGKGQPLLLVHGFGQNWYTWNRLLPELSKHFTVIAPDLRGVGESGKPAGGYDKKTMAVDLHELMKKLGYKNIDIAGHDIGMIVAYAYAAQFPGLKLIESHADQAFDRFRVERQFTMEHPAGDPDGEL